MLDNAPDGDRIAYDHPHGRRLYSHTIHDVNLDVLGPDADKPDGKVAGLPLDQLLGFWRKPFESDETSEGGCPALPVPPPGPPPAPRPFAPLSHRQRRWREFAAKWYA